MITDEEKRFYFWGLPNILGDVIQDIFIDYYLDRSDGVADFGEFLYQELKDDFERVRNLKNKEQLVKDMYVKFKGLKSFSDIDGRSGPMRRRWALEKQANGGFSQMDRWRLHPEELEAFLRPAMEQIERGEVVTAEESRARIQKLFYNKESEIDGSQ
jgi:hypothetical protein